MLLKSDALAEEALVSFAVFCGANDKVVDGQSTRQGHLDACTGALVDVHKYEMSVGGNDHVVVCSG